MHSADNRVVIIYGASSLALVSCPDYFSHAEGKNFSPTHAKNSLSPQRAKNSLGTRLVSRGHISLA